MVFEHAIRIRLKSDIDDSENEKTKPPVDDSTTQISTLGENLPVSVQPDAPGTIEAVEDVAANQSVLPSDAPLTDSTAYSSTTAQSDTQSSSSTSKQDKPAKATAAADIPQGEEKADTKKKSPILGKINNLLTSDINQIKLVQVALSLRMSYIKYLNADAFLNIFFYSIGFHPSRCRYLVFVQHPGMEVRS